MEVLGNLELLKSEIKKEFSRQFEEYQKEMLKLFEAEKSSIMEQHEKEMKNLLAEIRREKKTVFKSVLSDEKLEAKKEYEKKREVLINSAFKKAVKKSNKAILSKEYIEMINQFIKNKNDAVLTGCSEEYKKIFPGLNIDKKIDGIVVKAGDSIIDFTYSTFMESKKSELRHKISKILFENKA
jgi:vacuolar-type H+-ATPase subunit E/Vma4